MLRAARESDFDDLHAVFSDPRAMRYWDRPPHAPEETRALLDYMIRAEGSHEFIVEHDGRAVGKAGCWQLPEVGYILHPDLWGRGLATEAVHAALTDAFACHPGLDRVTADIHPENVASARVLEKLGFAETRRAIAGPVDGPDFYQAIWFALPRGALRPL